MSVAEKIGKLSPEQRALLRSKLQRKYGEGDTLAPRPDRSTWPMAYAQERFWLLEQIDPGPLYNNYAGYRFLGPFDLRLLERSLNTVLERHEALRALFPAVEGRPEQIVVPLALRLSLIDLSGLPEGRRETEARRLSTEETQRPFDLAVGPLVRFQVYRIAPGDHHLILNLHHIVCDGWSSNILLREMSVLYASFAQGRPNPLPPLPIQYADFAWWQRQWMQGGLISRQLEYWKERLAGAPTTLVLPSDRQRPRVRSGRGSRIFFSLDRRQAQSFSALGRQQAVTPFMAQLALVESLLLRYTGQEDFLLGSPVAGRNRIEVEHLIGNFVNTLVLRCEVAGDPSFRELLARARETVAGAFANQDLPFEKLVEEVQPERLLTQTPLFQVMFVSQVGAVSGVGAPLGAGMSQRPPGVAAPEAPAPAGEAAAGQVDLQGVPVDNLTTKFDLSFVFLDAQGALSGWIEYDSDLFDRPTVARMLGHFESLMAGAVADPDCPLSRLPLLTEAERTQTLREWNDTRRDWAFAGNGTLYELFAEQASRTPEALALAYWDGSGTTQRLTYAEARRRANRLAHRLRALGVKADETVGICVERSLDMPLTVLAVLQAGGAFVPMDPANPADRLAYMLEDSRARVLLTRRGVAPDLPVEGLEVLYLEDLGNEDGDLPEVREPAADPRHPVYLIYTSGTTGRPKGIVLPQRCLVNVVRWHAEFYGSPHRVLGFASFSFDVHFQEMFAALSTGGSFHLVPDEARRDAVLLARMIEEERTEEMILPVVVLQQLAEHCAGQEEILASARRVTSAGEAMKVTPAVVRLFERLRDKGIPCTLHNFYGPSEAHGISAFTLHGPPSTWPESPSIGRPIPNDRIYLLDRAGQPVPIGIPGELFVGGEHFGQCLARGYAHKPELSAAKFVPDAVGRTAFPDDGPGDRLYRSGDLARWNADGSIEFLGRIDHQVKIRGFRIELGEIEAVLARHPAVHEAAVLAVHDPAAGRTGKRLAAFVVGDAHAANTDGVTTADLRDFLSRSLPDYMVPTLWVRLDAMPLTPNGKVNRQALERLAFAPEEEAAEERSYTPPRGPVEEALAAIWEEVLGAEQIGADDDFFALGGHSLLATQLLARVRRIFEVDLPLRELFEGPTVARLARRIQDARAEQSGTLAPPIEPAPRSPAGDPLSFAQQRLWFLDRLQPDSPAYNVPIFLRLTQDDPAGPALDWTAFSAAVAEVRRRQEGLRTTFHEVHGEPRQVVAPPAADIPALPLVDLSALPDPVRERQARRLAAAEHNRPFDLAAGSLLRLCLVRLAAHDHLFVGTIHHVITDAWSTEILVAETAILYAAFAQRRPSPLPELPIQYADFAVWQRRWIAGEVLDRQLAYWREKLAGAAPSLELPTDRPRPPVQTYRGAAGFRTLAGGLPAAVRALGRREAATTYTTLLATCQALLSYLSGQEDFNVGTPITGRNRVETEGLIGFFANTLVLRADLSGEPTFRTLLGRARDTLLDAHAHADLPFEKLVEELQPERLLDRTPFFQVLFSAHPPVRMAPPVPGLQLGSLTPDIATSKFDLTLTLLESQEVFHAGVEYSTDLFDAATIDRFLARFEALLGAAMAEPDRPLATLPLLSEEERRQLEAWNETGTPAAPVCLHERFAAQARRTPDAVAVIHGHERWTYRDLDRRSDQIARSLRDQGVGLETRVAVRLPRTPDLIAAFLGVLKAGGAYVPVDPAYPADRQETMLADSGAAVFLTELPPACDETQPLPPSGVTPRNLAYVLYTSGSTGRPKGVAIEHRSVSALLDWAAGFFAAEATGAFLASTSVSFDVSVFEIYFPLTHGGRIVLVDNALALPELPAAAEPTTVSMVPSAAAELARTGGIPTSVRTLALGGEPLPAAVAAPLLELHHVERVLNLYGPTEDTTYSSYFEVERGRDAVLIGQPVAGTRAHVLDRGFRLVPVGTAGELYLAGAGLSRGYLGRPDLTAERFLPDPYGAAGERLYRTGDLARRLSSGELDYLGRIDHQVKIRGFRVELGEIEAVVARHPAVLAAAVLAVEGRAGKRLAAFVAGDPDTDDLRAFLSRSLPEYMVPTLFVRLDALPLTPNGKVDRRALERLPLASSASGDSREDAGGFIPPRGPVEEVLATLWEEVLGVEPIGADASFFSLGGHSLLATQLLARVRRVFELDLPLRELFEGPTVAQLARRIEAARAERTGVLLPPVEPLPRGQSAGGQGDPLSFAQQRLWFLDRLQPNSAAYNVPIFLRLTQQDPDRPGLDWPAFSAAVAEVRRRQDGLRTTFHEIHGEPRQVVAPAAPGAAPAPALPLVDLSGLPEEPRGSEARRLAAAEHSRPFDLAAGPLLRLWLARLAPHDHLFVGTMHHVITDAGSIEILVREAATLYAAFSQGLPSPLPELPVQYPDFAVWQRRWIAGEVLDRQLAYWREQLAGAAPSLELPTDRPRPPVQTYRGSHRARVLADDLPAAVRALGRSEAATGFTTLLAACQALLSFVSGQEDFNVGTPVTGRNRVETEGLIGFFANTLVLRADLSGVPTFRTLLGRARETLLQAHAHADLPFEKLVEELQPERLLDRTPFFQVLFSSQPPQRMAPPVPGLRLGAMTPEVSTSKFDLSLNVVEGQDVLHAGVEYSTDLFDAATIDRLLARFETLLAAATAEPDRPLSTLPLLSAEERRQLLEDWNATGTPAEPVCLHERFAAQARRTPHAVAVIHGLERWTYADLDRRADQIARFLRAQGVRPESRVAVGLPRTPDLIAALLGVLKAGAAYVPVDPAYPADRQAYMVADSGAAVFLKELPAAAGEAGEPLPAAGVTPGNLAYVLYTSGSTGQPKGVAVEHRSVSALLDWASRFFAAEAMGAFLASTSVSFDVSVFEIYFPLTHGGRIVLADNALALPDLRAASEVTVVSTVPSVLAELVRTGGLPVSARTLALAGEPLPPALAASLLELPHVERILNLYGPTEDTTYSTWSGVERDGEVLIGRPIAGTRAHVLNGSFQLVAVGAAGELCLGGAGLARGYLGRPDLTAERFVPDPFGAPGERLYRTGDLVRRKTSGELDYLGRIDHQIKIRGFRVELGEVEAALAAVAGVREAVVLAREDRPGDRRLVAFLVPENATGTASLGEDSLREALSARLPEYMVPSRFVALDGLPRTPNGKVDRRALARLDLSGPAAAGRPFVAPRDRVELQVARIWEELLGTGPVGVHDSFFALGGHSLLAVSLAARIREAFGRDIPVATLFQAATVERLAGLLRREALSASSPLVKIQSGGAEAPLFLVHPVGGGVLCYADLAGRLGPRTVYGLESPGLNGEAEPLPTVEAMAERYLTEIRQVQPQGPYRLGGWSLGGLVAFEMARRLEQEGSAARIVLLDTTPPGGYGAVSDSDLLLGFTRDLAATLGHAIPEEVADEIRRSEVEAGLARLLALAQEAGLVPPGLDAARVRQLFQVFRANYQAATSYEGGTYGGPARFIEAEVTRDQDPDRAAQWRRRIPGLQTRTLEGNHYDLVRSPLSGEVASLLIEDIGS